MSRVSYVFILATIVFISCRQSDKSLYQKEVESAEDLQEKGKYEAALSTVNHALEINENGIAALYQKGRIFALERKYDSAILYCNKAIHEKGSDTLYIDVNTNNPLLNGQFLDDVNMNFIKDCRGVSFYMLSKYSLALDDFEFCLSNGYNNEGSIFLYAGFIYIARGQTSKA